MRVSRRTFVALAASGATLQALPPALRASPPSLLLRDVRVADGTGAPAYAADVLVRGDTIERIGRIPPREAPGARVVEGGGRVLAPGFIDLHAHGDPLENPFDSHLAMGVTTIVLGQDGGNPGRGSAAAWLAAADRADLGINVATFSGHGSLRRLADIGDDVREPPPAQLARMAELLEADLRAGAFGMSTGLEYVPGMYAGPAEISALCRVLARHDGVASSHMRSEDDDRVEASVREHVEASRPARPHVSHLKVVHGRGVERAERLLETLRRYRDGGVPLTADAYPYEASYTTTGILFPDWARPPNDYAQVVAQRRGELRAALERRMEQRGGPGALLLGDGPHAGRTLAQLAGERGQAYPDVLVELGPSGGSAAHFVMDPELQDRLLLDPFVAIASDGSPRGRHPRGHGTFARWIAQFAATGRVPLEEAVRKATGLPASILRLRDRGTIRAGAKADLVLFDPAAVRDRATYVDPFALAEGFDLVVLNGQPAWERGGRVARAGRVLRRQPS